MRTFLLWLLSAVLAVAKLAEIDPVVTWSWLVVLIPILMSGALNFYGGFKEGLYAAMMANKHGE